MTRDWRNTMRLLDHSLKFVLIPAILLSLCFYSPAHARKKPPLAVIQNSAWIHSGEYTVRAKRTGLNDAYAIEFIVDFFADGTYTLECLPIEEEADFFSGTWSQKRNKLTLIFDQISQLILTDIFEEQFAADPEFADDVDVFIERWEIKSKLRKDATGGVFIKFKERLRHKVFSDGISIRVKTRGKGTASFFEVIGE